MKVFIKGTCNSANLLKDDLLACGGEGEIYLKDDIIFKIYINRKKIIPYSKIKELSVITYPNVIKPQQLVLNKKDEVNIEDIIRKLRNWLEKMNWKYNKTLIVNIGGKLKFTLSFSDLAIKMVQIEDALKLVYNGECV